MDWPRHAEQHFKNKKESKKGLNFMLEGDKETIVYVMRENRDTDRSRSRGKGCRRNKGGGSDRDGANIIVER